MLTIFSYITTLFALFIITVSLFIGYSEGKGIRDSVFQLQRKAMLGAYVCLIFYLMTTFFRYTDGEVEIMQTMSLVSLYFIFEIYFFSSTAFNQAYYFNNKGYWIFFNSPPLIVFIIHEVLILTGNNVKYFTFQDFITDFNGANVIVSYFKIFFVALLFLYKTAMVYLIFMAWRNRKIQLAKDPSYHYHSTRVGRVLLLWFLMLNAFYVGQFVNLTLYHIIAKLLLCALIAYNMNGFQRLYRVTNHTSNLNKQFANLHKRIENWLDTTPFPLGQQGISIDQISTALEVSREELSFYIYNILGLTFNGWISSLRLERCVQLLEESQFNMSEIAYTTGYAHLAAMSKAFKAKYGSPPREYRKDFRRAKAMATDKNKNGK